MLVVFGLNCGVLCCRWCLRFHAGARELRQWCLRFHVGVCERWQWCQWFRLGVSTLRQWCLRFHAGLGARWQWCLRSHAVWVRAGCGVCGFMRACASAGGGACGFTRSECWWLVVTGGAFVGCVGGLVVTGGAFVGGFWARLPCFVLAVVSAVSRGRARAVSVVLAVSCGRV